MSSSHPRLLVTAANGQLGRLVLDGLLDAAPPGTVSAAARRPEELAAYAARGVDVRRADYADPASLEAAMNGIDRLLLISSSEIGSRAEQHRNAIEAAHKAGVRMIAYTSVLQADTSPLALAEEHRQTEALLRDTGLAVGLLRNGWYLENYAFPLASAVERGVLLGSAGDGRISAAARADYAAAAVAVLLAAGEGVQVHELAGDDSFTLAELVAEASAQAGRLIRYQDVPEPDYRAVLLEAGLPAPLAGLLADADSGIAKGALFDGGHALRALIGRPTTPWRQAVRSMVKDGQAA